MDLQGHSRVDISLNLSAMAAPTGGCAEYAFAAENTALPNDQRYNEKLAVLMRLAKA